METDVGASRWSRSAQQRSRDQIGRAEGTDERKPTASFGVVRHRQRFLSNASEAFEAPLSGSGVE